MGFSDWFGVKKRQDAAERPIGVELTRIGGSAELSYLFIDVPGADILRALESWSWLSCDGLTVVAVSAFGEVFFRDEAGAIHQLDTIEGKITKVADSHACLTAMLQESGARDSLLLGGLVNAARQAGLVLATGECYDFRLPPVLGGQIGVGEMKKLSFVVKLDVAGQLHEQIRDLPPATPIKGVNLAS